MSPLLFNVLMSDFPPPPPGCNVSLFADDIVLYSTAKSSTDAEKNLQEYLAIIEEWTVRWRLEFSENKCVAVLFSRKKKQQEKPQLLLDGYPIELAPTFKFLGVTFDLRLTWASHITTVTQKIRRYYNIMKSLTTGRKILKLPLLTRIYKAIIRSKIDYGSIVLSELPPSRLIGIDVAQNQVLRIMLGCPATTPLSLLYFETGITPVQARWKQLAAAYTLRLESNPAYADIKNALESLEVWKPSYNPAITLTCQSLSTKFKSMFRREPSPLPVIQKFPPWSKIDVEVFILPIAKREAVLNPTAAVNLLNETLEKKPSSHLAIYTDGSVCQQTRKAACGVYVPKESFEGSWSLSSTSSILTTELTAIWKALSSFRHSEYELISIITDSRSSVQVIKNYRASSNPLVSAIIEEIYGYNLQLSGDKSRIYLDTKPLQNCRQRKSRPTSTARTHIPLSRLLQEQNQH